MIPSPHRPTRIRVDLEAISSNLRQIKNHLSTHPKVYAVVKANAYGHGAVAVAQFLKDQVDGFCVSNLDEALELRKAGILAPILLLGVICPEDVSLARENNCRITVASLAWLQEVLTHYPNLSGLVCHLKVDSGMGRIGMREAREVNQVMSLLEQSGAVVEGIFTHFATADEADKTQYNQQLSCFENLLHQLPYRPLVVHTSNSAASLWHQETAFTAVRLGLALYGLNPSNGNLSLPYPLSVALSLETKLVHVKQLHQNDTVGYGASYQATADEWIATLPIGYADGWLRALQGFQVLLDGQACPIVGRISMDQTTIRLPRAYPLGQQVTLIGKNGDSLITTEQVANYLGTINYEVLCLLSDRIPRYYVCHR